MVKAVFSPAQKTRNFTLGLTASMEGFFSDFTASERKDIAFTAELGDSDWEEYLKFESARRGISVDAVRCEEDAAKAALSRIAINRAAVDAAVSKADPNHPYLDGNDKQSPF